MSDSEKKKIGLAEIKNRGLMLLKQVRPYSLVFFLVFVGLLYGFLLLKISSLSNAQPSATDISNQVKAAQTPHIDPAVVKQLESLRDNSVNVQGLFNEARNNPFKECLPGDTDPACQ